MFHTHQKNIRIKNLMNTNMAVIIDPQFPPKEIPIDESYDPEAIIGCNICETSVPGYLTIFRTEAPSSYRKEHGIPDIFDPRLCLIYDENYFQTQSNLNKICSDIYSACRKKPWPILGKAILKYCSLEQFYFIYKYIPIYLKLDPRIENIHKNIILARDASGYDIVLKNLAEYR
jgi:hypothetical protein